MQASSKSCHNRLLRTTGIGSYVITVLVPELAVMLVNKGMKVCDESSRQILQESARALETYNTGMCGAF
jgi:RTC4-like domain